MISRTEITEGERKLVLRHGVVGQLEEKRRIQLLAFGGGIPLSARKPSCSLSYLNNSLGRLYLLVPFRWGIWHVLTGRWPKLVLRTGEGECTLEAAEIPASSEGLATRFARTFSASRIYPLSEELLEVLKVRESCWLEISGLETEIECREPIEKLLSSPDIPK